VKGEVGIDNVSTVEDIILGEGTRGQCVLKRLDSCDEKQVEATDGKPARNAGKSIIGHYQPGACFESNQPIIPDGTLTDRK
jgi:hypothetical protein